MSNLNILILKFQISVAGKMCSFCQLRKYYTNKHAILVMTIWPFMMVDPMHPQLLENFVVILFQHLACSLQATRCLYNFKQMIMMMANVDLKLDISQVHMVKFNFRIRVNPHQYFLVICQGQVSFKNARAKLVNHNCNHMKNYTYRKNVKFPKILKRGKL